MTDLPQIIQGGMGVGVSGWALASAVARAGQLGVVSGTALDTVFARRLQDGDPDGGLRRAIAAFPLRDVANEALRRWFRLGGRVKGERYAMLPLYRAGAGQTREGLTMLAAFAEVWLAREGHSGQIGINLLTKVQYPTLATLYGAMLAGVDVVLMGAGIPREIPAALDALAAGVRASLTLHVIGDGVTVRTLTLDPETFFAYGAIPQLKRPAFYAIVASSSLATMLTRKSSGHVDGFIVEGPTAGGHNAPPRGPLQLSESGQPIYGPRDVVGLDTMRWLGRPFWIAGGAGSPAALENAIAQGAAGVQVGTLFAFAEESGLDPELRRSALEAARAGQLTIHTDPRASPTGYPFKIADWPGAQPAVRSRTCDLGYLRDTYRRSDGGLGYRCASEPVDAYVAKGGLLCDTVGRRCLCNALTAAIGQGQLREDGSVEPAILTSGDDLTGIGVFLGERTEYRAADVVEYLGKGRGSWVVGRERVSA